MVFNENSYRKAFQQNWRIICAEKSSLHSVSCLFRLWCKRMSQQSDHCHLSINWDDADHLRQILSFAIASKFDKHSSREKEFFLTRSKQTFSELTVGIYFFRTATWVGQVGTKWFVFSDVTAILQNKIIAYD